MLRYSLLDARFTSPGAFHRSEVVDVLHGAGLGQPLGALASRIAFDLRNEHLHNHTVTRISFLAAWCHTSWFSKTENTLVHVRRDHRLQIRMSGTSPVMHCTDQRHWSDMESLQELRLLKATYEASVDVLRDLLQLVELRHVGHGRSLVGLPPVLLQTLDLLRHEVEEILGVRADLHGTNTCLYTNIGPRSRTSDTKLPSARLTLHFTKLCTNLKNVMKKSFLVLMLPLRHFEAFSQNLKATRLQGRTQTKLWTCWRNSDLSRSFERFLGLVHGFAVLQQMV